MSSKYNQIFSLPIIQTIQGTVICDSSEKRLLKDDKVKCEEHSIKVIGLCPEIELENKLHCTDLEWTEIQLPQILCIPCKNPIIHEIMSVKVKVDIISQKVIRTPVFKLRDKIKPVENYEGLESTGRQLVIECLLRHTVKYTAANKEKSLHGVYFDVPFSAFVVLEKGTSLHQKYNIDACIEDIFICTLNPSQIFKNVTVFFKVDPVESWIL